jgi:hypothetical protein
LLFAARISCCPAQEVAAIVGGVMTIGSFVDALVSLVGEHFGKEQRKRAAAGGGLVT